MTNDAGEWNLSTTTFVTLANIIHPVYNNIVFVKIGTDRWASRFAFIPGRQLNIILWRTSAKQIDVEIGLSNENKA